MNVCPWEPIFYIIPKATNCCTVISQTKTTQFHQNELSDSQPVLFPHDLPTLPHSSHISHDHKAGQIVASVSKVIRQEWQGDRKTQA